jgi:uncharacterized membrane protein
MTERRLVAWVLAVAGYALLSHGLMVYAADRPWAVAALFAPGLIGLGGWALAGRRIGWLLAVGLAVAVLVLVTWRGGAGEVNRLYLAQHVGIHLALAVGFGSTLRGDAVPMITAFALRVHRNRLTPAMAAYTRRLTAVWTGYFVAMALASLAIYAGLPWAAWSFFANLLTPLFAVLLFGGEHLLRYRRHPEFERAHWREALQASMQPASAPEAPVTAPELRR